MDKINNTLTDSTFNLIAIVSQIEEEISGSSMLAKEASLPMPTAGDLIIDAKNRIDSSVERLSRVLEQLRQL